MKFSMLTAFIGAMLVHLALLALLVVNVSLEKPQRPQDEGVKIMHATMVSPKALGKETGKAAPPLVKKEEVAQKPSSDKAAEEALALKQRIEAQKKAEQERALALKKKQEEEKKKLEEQKRREAEAKAKQEAEAKVLAEAKAKQEAEAKKQAQEEAKKKAEEEAKRLAQEQAKKLEAEAKKAAQEEALRKAAEEASALEEELLGTADGSADGAGLGSGGGVVAEYGAKVQTLIEQNWRIDPSMNNKRVVVTLDVDAQGLISNEKCTGDKAVCDSALSTLRLIGMLPMPPQDCPDCHSIVITMTPKVQ